MTFKITLGFFELVLDVVFSVFNNNNNNNVNIGACDYLF